MLFKLAIPLAREIFDAKKLSQAPTRQGFGTGLVEAGKKDKRVVALCADLTESTQMHLFAKEFPERFVEVGVAEQNLVTVASGMAAAGKIPFTASYAVFSPGRNWEQIRTTICYNNQNVKVVGSHSGLTVGPDGATHQALEDIALMRVLPNMQVVYPADAWQAHQATVQIAASSSPTYLRLAREKSPVFTTSKTPFVLGQANVYTHGTDVTLMACGSLVYEALVAANLLSGKISVEVINIHTIKPLDDAVILNSVRRTGRAVTLEEHQIYGGLGGAVAELLSQELPVPLLRLGVNDSFGESGNATELWDKFGLTAKHIADRLTNFCVAR